MDLHFLHNLIQRLSTPHSQVDKNNHVKKQLLTSLNASTTSTRLLIEIYQRTYISTQEEYNTLQRNLHMESKAKEKAKQL
jgi:hypothetical protein